MTAALAPASGTTVPDAGAPGDIPSGRVLDRAVPTTVVLRLAVVVLGLLIVATGDGALGPGVLAAAALLLGHVAVLAAGARRPVAGTADGDGRLVRGTAVSLLATVVSGGWWSPFGAVLAIDLALSGLARGYRRAFATAAGLALVLLVTVPFSAPLAPATSTTSLPVLLALAAALGGFAHGLVATDHHGLGPALHLSDANRLAADLHLTLRSLPTAPDAVTVSRAALDWVRTRVPFGAAAVVALERGEATLVHAEGTALAGEDAAALAATAPDGIVVTPVAALGGSGRLTAWLPLELRGRPVGLVAIELADDGTAADVPRVLTTLAEPLAVALDTARWFARLSTLSGELERSRIASELSDRLCQSMAATTFVLDRAAARTGDPELSRVAETVRSEVVDLGRTLDDLRAHVDDDPDLEVVVAGCVERAAARAGFLPGVHVEVDERLPHVVEQQVLRVLQELLAALDGATVATVTWRAHDGQLELAVRHDGRLVPPRPVFDRADAVGAEIIVSAVPGGNVLTLTTEAPS
ncbi:MAG: hypothetical protein KY457_03310 [Actinobacteria bacterium]|nr:hypothetical protein [Actinomycetota bacterium]